MNLTHLANRFGSDKGTVTGIGGAPHRYTYLYDLLLPPYRTRPINLLELGLAVCRREGDQATEHSELPPTVQMWLEYFPEGQIFGFGRSDLSHIDHPRFKFYRGDLGSETDLRGLAGAVLAFDIIIDAGSHASYHQQLALKLLFPKLTAGGLYIIEAVDELQTNLESSLPVVPRTLEFLIGYFEHGQYIENPLLSTDTMDEFKRATAGFSHFPPFDGRGGPANLIVLHKREREAAAVGKKAAEWGDVGIAGHTETASPAAPVASTHLEAEAIALKDHYYLVSYHDTVLYVDAAAQRFRHAPFGIAAFNLILEVVGSQARLMTTADFNSELLQVSVAQPSGEVLVRTGGADLDFEIETFADGSIGLRAGGKYVSADLDGFVRNDRDWCAEFERYRLVRADTLDGLAVLRRYSWLSHDDRRIICLTAQPIDFGREDPNHWSALAGTLAPQAIDFRRELVFGPARLRLAGREPSILVGGSDPGDRDPPGCVHIVDRQGFIHGFSRFKPLIYYCLYGDASLYECLHLSLASLAEYGCFDGAVGVACDRPANELVKYIPETFHHRLILSDAAEERGSFNRYYLDHGLYDTHQPILYCDVAVVFDASITDLLIDILRCEQVCCATEEGIPPHLADGPPRLWDEGEAEKLGRNFSASNPEFCDANVSFGNSGMVGFANTARIKGVNALVRMLASRRSSDTFGNQPILNYVLHKTRLGNFQALDRYCRVARSLQDVPPAERRGLTLFDAASGTSSAPAEASLMRSYLDALRRHEAEREEHRTDVELSLSIPGQMEVTELDRLASLARRVAPNGCIVEVGSLFGQSSWTLAKNTHTSVTVYCLDPWVREPWMLPIEERAGQGLSLQTFRENTAGLSNIIPLRGSSPREFVGWQRTIDLLFLGTARANPGLHYNLTFWAGFVRPGGWICGHAYSDGFPDVKTEVDRLATAVGTRVNVAETLWSMRVPEDYPRYGV